MRAGVQHRAEDDRPASRLHEATAKRDGVPGAQAIGRALIVLQAFGRGNDELSISQLAESCGLTPSTTHRICRALVAEGFLQQDESTARYSLGHAAVLLGQLAQRNYGLDRAHRLLERVAERTSESVNLGINLGPAAMVLLRVESSHPLRLEQPPGTRISLHASAMGKAFLAFSPDPTSTVDALMPLEKFTDSTLVDPEDLIRHLVRIRSDGYSIDDEEGIIGVRCVGAPVLDRRGNAVAAVAIQVPTARMPVARFGELGPVVVDLARQVAEVLHAGRSMFFAEV